jgi:hypothetical protein
MRKALRFTPEFALRMAKSLMSMGACRPAIEGSFVNGLWPDEAN